MDDPFGLLAGHPRCPTCGSVFDSPVVVFGEVDAKPEDGDPLVCHTCGEILILDGPKFRIPTWEEGLYVYWKQPMIRGIQVHVRTLSKMDS